MTAVAIAIFVVLASGSSPQRAAADANCSDFANQAAAQAYYVAHGGPASDPDQLDADRDGRACQSLPCPCSSSSAPAPGPTPTPAAPSSGKTVRQSGRIAAVVDGDIVKVRLTTGRTVTVRVIGIDTPETKRPGTAVECGGPQASGSMKRLAFQRGRGRGVTLVSDRTQDRVDRYGRTLAYVDATGKGDLGAAQIKAGWASVYVYANTPFQRYGRYTDVQDSARDHARGAWKLCGGDFHKPSK